jgi:hypothetical protein
MAATMIHVALITDRRRVGADGNDPGSDEP